MDTTIERPSDSSPTPEELRKREIIDLATELSRSGETFPFAGIEAASYTELEASDAEFPDFTTPVGEIKDRLRNEGMKVVLGQHPESGNVFVLPAQSNNIEMDSISPKHLAIGEGMDPRLAELIMKTRGY